MNLTIRPEAATEDAKNIEEIIATIDSSMKELNEVIKRLIPERLETEWSNRLAENWQHFYNETIQDSMIAMQQSSESLKRAVEAALAYNK